MDLNQTLILSGVSDPERLPNPCSLQADLHSQLACRAFSAANPITQLHRVPFARQETL